MTTSSQPSNPNLKPYPYDRTFVIADRLGTNPSPAQAAQLAMWVREQHGEVCVVDGTGCTLSDDFLRAAADGMKSYSSYVQWRGITRENRETLERWFRQYPRQL